MNLDLADLEKYFPGVRVGRQEMSAQASIIRVPPAVEEAYEAPRSPRGREERPRRREAPSARYARHYEARDEPRYYQPPREYQHDMYYRPPDYGYPYGPYPPPPSHYPPQRPWTEQRRGELAVEELEHTSSIASVAPSVHDSSLRNEITELKEKVSVLQKRAQTAEEALEAAEEAKLEALRNAEIARSEGSEAVGVSAEERTAMNNALHDERARADELRDQLRESEKNASELRATVASMRAQYQESSARLDQALRDAQEKLQVEGNDLAVARETQAELVRERDEARALVAQARVAANDAQGRANKLEERFTHLQAELNEHKTASAQNGTALSTVEREKAVLNEKVVALTQERNALADAVHAREQELRNAFADISALQNERDGLKLQVSSLEGRLTAAQRSIQPASPVKDQEIARLRADLEFSQKRVTALETEREHLSQQVMNSQTMPQPVAPPQQPQMVAQLPQQQMVPQAPMGVPIAPASVIGVPSHYQPQVVVRPDPAVIAENEQLRNQLEQAGRYVGALEARLERQSAPPPPPQTDTMARLRADTEANEARRRELDARLAALEAEIESVGVPSTKQMKSPPPPSHPVPLPPQDFPTDNAPADLVAREQKAVGLNKKLTALSQERSQKQQELDRLEAGGRRRMANIQRRAYLEERIESLGVEMNGIRRDLKALDLPK